MSEVPGIDEAVRALLASVETALPVFGPAELTTLPQPGRVQFVIRARPDGVGEWMQLVAITSQAAQIDATHPLSVAFERANEVLRIAG